MTVHNPACSFYTEICKGVGLDQGLLHFAAVGPATPACLPVLATPCLIVHKADDICNMSPPSMMCLSSGCISLFHEKPTGDDLANLKSVSQNATEQDPFEASMGIYVFKRDVLVGPAAAAC